MAHLAATKAVKADMSLKHYKPHAYSSIGINLTSDFHDAKFPQEEESFVTFCHFRCNVLLPLNLVLYTTKYVHVVFNIFQRFIINVTGSVVGGVFVNSWIIAFLLPTFRSK